MWRTAEHLRAAFADTVLTGCDLRTPTYATVDLSGDTVREIVSRGKHLLMRIGSTTLHTHLAMEGAWHLHRHGQRWRRPGHQARAVLTNQDWQAVGFSLGRLDVVPTAHEHSLVGHLGPDLLGDDWDPDLAVTNVLTDPDRPLGLALLDQRNLAGIGNIYRSELCFVRGVDPRCSVGQVDDLDRLVRTASKMLRVNLRQAAIVTTGNTRRGEQTWVYGRAGEPCRRCGTTILRAELGDQPGSERSIYLCPACQPA